MFRESQGPFSIGFVEGMQVAASSTGLRGLANAHELLGGIAMTKLRIVESAFSLTAIALMIGLVVGQAVAQDVDAKGDKELTQLTQKIDKSAADRDRGRVTSKIVDEWKGTKFKFDPNSTPRELTAQDVQDLRGKKLGYGESSILLALTAKQSNSATAKSVSEILAMRQAGEGWGKLARDLGYKNLGSVVKSVKATEKDVTKVAMERNDKPDKSGKTDKPDKPEKPERLEKPEKPEKPEKAEKPGR